MNSDAIGTMNCRLATSNCGRLVCVANVEVECSTDDGGVGNERDGDVALINGEDEIIGHRRCNGGILAVECPLW
jgi:hypothetical protein